MYSSHSYGCSLLVQVETFEELLLLWSALLYKLDARGLFNRACFQSSLHFLQKNSPILEVFPVGYTIPLAIYESLIVPTKKSSSDLLSNNS